MKKFLSWAVSVVNLSVALSKTASPLLGFPDLSPTDLVFGSFARGKLYYEDLLGRDRRKTMVIASGLTEEMCTSDICQASWSYSDSGAWVAVRELRNNEVVVLGEDGRVVLRTRCPFEVRSMLSVSRDGKTVAVIGRMRGVDSVWHLDSQGARPVWTLGKAGDVARTQVAWFAESTSNLLSDGEWVLRCDHAPDMKCHKILKGILSSVSPDGTLASALIDVKTNVIYDLKTNQVRASLRSNTEWAADAAKWSPDSRTLILHERHGDASGIVVFGADGERKGRFRNLYDKTFSRLGVLKLPANMSTPRN